MATVPIPTTWVDGTVVHGSDLNSQVRDSINFLLGTPMCQAYSVSGVASVPNLSNQLISFDGESYDNDNMHNIGTNPSRMFFQTLGWFDIQAYGGFAANGTGGRYVMLRLNSAANPAGGGFVASLGYGAIAFGSSMSVEINITYQAVNVGDYMEMFLQQNSGGALAVVGGQYDTGMTSRWVHN